MDLAGFIAARLGDDEAAANAALTGWPPNDVKHRGTFPVSLHIARHDPARVLREVAAKRAILAAYNEALRIQAGFREVSSEEANREALGRACRHLATVWSDHPDYDPAWKP